MRFLQPLHLLSRPHGFLSYGNLLFPRSNSYGAIIYAKNRFSRRHCFNGTLPSGAIQVGGFGSVPSLKSLGYKSLNEKLGR
jgi:hypothetical protein